MPTYLYRCGSCGTSQDADFPIGEAPRIGRCGDCGGTAHQVLGHGLQIAAAALPNKRAGVISTLQSEKTLDTDRDAYKRMRRRGIQPKQIDGSSNLENTVEDNFDVNYGKFYNRAKTRTEARTRIREGLEQAQEIAETTGNDWLKKNAEPVA